MKLPDEFSIKAENIRRNPMKKIFFLYILAVAAKQGKPTDEKADDSGKEDEPPAGKY